MMTSLIHTVQIESTELHVIACKDLNPQSHWITMMGLTSRSSIDALVPEVMLEKVVGKCYSRSETHGYLEVPAYVACTFSRVASAEPGEDLLGDWNESQVVLSGESIA